MTVFFDGRQLLFVVESAAGSWPPAGRRNAQLYPPTLFAVFRRIPARSSDTAAFLGKIFNAGALRRIVRPLKNAEKSFLPATAQNRCAAASGAELGRIQAHIHHDRRRTGAHGQCGQSRKVRQNIVGGARYLSAGLEALHPVAGPRTVRTGVLLHESGDSAAPSAQSDRKKSSHSRGILHLPIINGRRTSRPSRPRPFRRAKTRNR